MFLAVIIVQMNKNCVICGDYVSKTTNCLTIYPIMPIA